MHMEMMERSEGTTMVFPMTWFPQTWVSFLKFLSRLLFHFLKIYCARAAEVIQLPMSDLIAGDILMAVVSGLSVVIFSQWTFLC